MVTSMGYPSNSRFPPFRHYDAQIIGIINMFRRTCPRCFSSYIYKSRFWLVEYLLPLLLLRPVRCRDCGRRYYRLIFLSALHPRNPGQGVPSDFSD